jgi:hypothetical protein
MYEVVQQRFGLKDGQGPVGGRGNRETEPKQGPPREAAGKGSRDKESYVRRKSKPSPATIAASTGTTRARRTMFGLACLCVLGLVAFAGSGAPASAADACPNEVLRLERHATTLPECRAWEMVSPPDKNGGSVTSSSVRTRAAADGSAAEFSSLQAFGDARGTGVSTEYIAERGGAGNGWQTHAITPAQGAMTLQANLLPGEPVYEGELSDDLRTGVFMAWTPLTPEPHVASATNLYRRTDLRSAGAGSYDLVTACPICVAPMADFAKLFRPGYAGASQDFGHIAFDSGNQLTADSSLFSRQAFEWDHGTVRLAGILPDGTPAPVSVAGRGAAGGEATAGTRVTTENPISRDGSRLVFMASSTGGISSGQVEGDVYLRINHRTTVQVNANERDTADAPQPAEFWDMSSDADRVFFTTAASLTEDAPVNSARKAYMWSRQLGNETQSVAVSATGGEFTLVLGGLSTESIPFDASAATVESELEALSTIGAGNVSVSGGPADSGGASPYLITFKGDLDGVDVAEMTADATLLSGGASTATMTTVNGLNNLTYLGGGGEDVRGVIGASDDGRYVYYLAVTTIYLWHDGTVTPVGSNEIGDTDLLDRFALFLRLKQSYVTPDGRHLMYASFSGGNQLSLHGGSDYNQSGCGGGSCRELYVYSADTDSLACVSCKLGASPAASASSRSVVASGATQLTNHFSRTLSDDGRYAFFSTAEALVPEDTNGVSDAYEYDLQTGDPHLLSSGESPTASYFMDTSADGKDAFFTTSQALTGWDTDKASDLYDARVGGGFPEPPVPPPSCLGDACQPAPTSLNDPTPGSSTFKGVGNPKPARKHKKARKHHHKRHAKHAHKRAAHKRANADRRASR